MRSIPIRDRHLRWIVFGVLRLTLVPLVFRELLQRRAVTVILYHDPEPALLERHLTTLARSYRFIALRTFVDAIREGTTDRLPRKSLVVTFDDGHIGNRELYGVLDRLGVPATIFLCSTMIGTSRRFWFGHIDDPQLLKRLSDDERLQYLAQRGFSETDPGGEPEVLTDEDIQAMQGPVIDFQSHGLTHPILVQCDDAKAGAEIVQSRQALSREHGLDIFAFSYPNGDYSERELRLVREAGYQCAVTAQPGFNTAGTNPFRLKRIPLDDCDDTNALVVKTSGLWGAVRRLIGRADPTPGRT